jgi:dihydroorotase
MILPALVDLHAHFRQPGAGASEDVASGEAAAAHGGYGAVALMPNSEPAADHPAILRDLVRSDSPLGLTLMPIAAATLGRAGVALSPMRELAAAGAVAFSDDGSPIADPSLFRNALISAGALGLPLIEHCEDPALTAGGEAADGLISMSLGLKPWPAAGEISAVVRNIALLREALHDEPRARLHLTHLSTPAIAAGRGSSAIGDPPSSTQPLTHTTPTCVSARRSATPPMQRRVAPRYATGRHLRSLPITRRTRARRRRSSLASPQTGSLGLKPHSAWRSPRMPPVSSRFHSLLPHSPQDQRRCSVVQNSRVGSPLVAQRISWW